MADSSSRSLLAPHRDPVKRPASSTRKRSAYKTPLIIFPLSAILIVSIFAAVAVLILSNHDPVESWKVQPSVLLSLLSSIYALALGALFMAGVAITWWRSLTHGTTLKRLHFIYAGADPKEFIRAIIAGSHARRVAFAGLFIFVARIATGPLLQRSTKSELRAVARGIDIDMNIAGEIPNGWYGTWSRPDTKGALLAQRTIFNSTIDSPLNPTNLCPTNGTCSALVSGAGLNYACTSETRTLKMDDKKNVNTTIFRIDYNITTKFGQPMLHLTTDYISSVDGSCVGTLTTDSCYIIPATVWYPITIRNSSISMDPFSLLNNLTILKNYTSSGDAPPADSSGPLGPLAGLQQSLASVFKSEALLDQNSNGQVLSIPSSKPPNSPSWPDLYLDPQASNQQCAIVYTNPTKIVLAHFFSFMFRSAYQVPKTSQDYAQKIRATVTTSGLWYTTDFRWLAAAITIMAIGILAAVTLLWGWWQLDHYTTLSPLETGKAFGAPILQGAGPKQEADAILQDIGHERVAHDGDELVWNGTVYASVPGSGSGIREMSGTPLPTHPHPTPSTPRHRRGLSSTSSSSGHGHGGHVPIPRPFEHSFGASTRRWDDSAESADLAYAGRSRANSAARDPDRDTAPLIITPGSPGVPELPPIPPTESLRMEPLSPRGRYRRLGDGGMETTVGRVGPEAQGEGYGYRDGDGGVGEMGQRQAPHKIQTQNLKRKVSLLDEISRRTPV